MMGFKDVDDEIRRETAMKQELADARKAAADKITYEKVSEALAADYFSIYIVDPDTDQFVQYGAAREYDETVPKRRAKISSALPGMFWNSRSSSMTETAFSAPFTRKRFFRSWSVTAASR